MHHPLPNRLAFVLSLVGILVSALLWSWHSHPQDIPCGLGGGCMDVARSPYSRFPYGSGPPVAAIGTFGYIALATLSFLRTVGSSDDADRRARRDRQLLGLSLLLSAGAALFASHLTYIELFVIHKICKWCIASQILIALICLLHASEWFSARRSPSS